MIFITGDTHATIDIDKIRNIDYLTEKDYLIICGDFGGVWSYPNTEYYKMDMTLQDWYKNRPFTTLFVDGNHENFDVLNNFYNIEMWNGGKVHKINNHLYHLMRGQTFNIENNIIFTLGGAESHDKEFRAIGVDWWKDELPTSAEYDEAISNLNRMNWKVDYVISHCQPSWFFKKFFRDNSFQKNPITNFFDIIEEEIKYKHWYSGHLHFDKTYKDITCLYQEVIPLGCHFDDATSIK